MKFKIKKPQYVLIGADYSQLEVKTAVFTSKDAQMKQAYLDGKDLYSLIASMAYELPYEDCLEFYPEGTKLEIEGKTIICGNEKEKEITYDNGFKLPFYYMVNTPAGYKDVTSLNNNDIINIKTNDQITETTITHITTTDDTCIIQTHVNDKNSVLNIKSPPKITNKQGKARRQASKSLLIGSLYQRGTASIAEQIKKSREEAQALMDNFYKGFPTIAKWMEDNKRFCSTHGYIENAIGRRRRLPDALMDRYSINVTESKQSKDFNPILICKNRDNTDLITKYKNKLKDVKSRRDFDNIEKEATIEGVIIKDNNGKIQQALRQSVNAPCQSLGADVAKRLMLNMDKDEILNKNGFRLLIQVHDEVIGECPEENAQVVADRLVYLMKQTPIEMGIDVPMNADSYIVRNWYEDELLTSIKATIMDNEDKSKDELFNMIQKEHEELLPEQIWKVLNDPDATLFG